MIYGTREVYELLRVLRAIDDPTNQLKVVTALRTSVFGIDDRQLMQYRHGPADGEPLRFPNEFRVFTKEPGVVGDALRVLDQFGRRKHERTPAELIAELYDRWRGVAAALSEGQQVARETWRRVRYVVDEARAWSDATGGTLAEYLAWVDRRIDDVDRVELSTDEGEDSLRIMTIHAAKGLEFPITIVAGLGAADASNSKTGPTLGTTASHWFGSGSSPAPGSPTRRHSSADESEPRRHGCSTSRSPVQRIISSSRCTTSRAVVWPAGWSRQSRRPTLWPTRCAATRRCPWPIPPVTIARTSRRCCTVPAKSPTSWTVQSTRCAGSGHRAGWPKHSATPPGRPPTSAWCRVVVRGRRRRDRRRHDCARRTIRCCSRPPPTRQRRSRSHRSGQPQGARPQRSSQPARWQVRHRQGQRRACGDAAGRARRSRPRVGHAGRRGGRGGGVCSIVATTSR